ncbi:PepSY domain-containing protein [Pedobacter sp. HMF7647]|uniref:PepSY domain-containing protein n=1 Tax=Hufsiella arboris TaxID=2695275 RepID=A0A7K1Y5G1_9SPHI|nr:PepSY-associated TM helix domain-containing protein [Hufsiella arboris]MXV49660.1 PepSY domain-containing protein [Hufsiella arboris]
MKKKRNLKYWIGRIHLWLGLTSGLVVFIVSLTGCLFCFHDEIEDITKPHRHVEARNQPYLPPSVLKENAQKAVPDGKISFLSYVGKDRPALAYTTNSTSTYYVYLDPYTGKHLKTEDLKTDFFIIVEYIHLYLLLPAEIGRQIVGISTIVFVVMLISGIILWWPKRKSDHKRSFKIKWNSKWRRVNYDLHNVLGFYAASIALVLALTGLAIDYEWMRKTFTYTANLGAQYPDEDKHPVIDTINHKPINRPVIDVAMAQTFKLSPASEMYFVTFPEKTSESFETGAYAKSLVYHQQNNYHFDPVSAQLLKSQPYKSKSVGMKLNEMNYAIHTGQILGLFGKIIAFIASLIATSLPVTGFIVWLGRRKKKSKAETGVKLVTTRRSRFNNVKLAGE